MFDTAYATCRSDIMGSDFPIVIIFLRILGGVDRLQQAW